jgi:hypothetical protein
MHLRLKNERVNLTNKWIHELNYGCNDLLRLFVGLSNVPSKQPGTQFDEKRSRAMTETIWRCDQVRAGQLYNRMMFDTKAEAEEFMQRMQKMEPDHMISIEAIEARRIWN